ncbi:MAG: hypothetical protein CVV47_02745 [Spirochaetae bacterium HGW-Spirochaetae-3]|jgi:hypothetical protein|nr:MAG: hypothetical protein CVV47_02745 [Spirochaetae bacterium HGW-Spirochaetae-3]
MRNYKARPWKAILLLIPLLAVACDIGNALFTDEELDSMYEISLTQNGSTLWPGSLVSPSKGLAVSVTGIDGAPEAASVELSLIAPDGTEAARLVFSTDEASIPNARAVKDFSSGIPSFTMPPGLTDGYYTFRIYIRNGPGETLSTYTTALLVMEKPITERLSLSVYPGSVSAGEISLLRLVTDGYPEGVDPWIRWVVDGSVQAVGFASEHADRLAWRAPEISGVYVAKAEIYPFRPPVGLDIPPMAQAKISMPLRTDEPSVDLLADNGEWSRLSFDGDFVDKGPRPREHEPTAIGSPYLETYASGFGYLLGDGDGVASASALVPVRNPDGRLAPFSALFVLAQPTGGAANGSGSLLSVSGKSESVGFEIGIDKGVPYIESEASRVTASIALPRSGATRLALYVSPSGTGAAVSFYIDDEPAGGGILESGLFETIPGACRVAGDAGYVAVYDELRIFDRPYPAFRIAEESDENGYVISASGFEGGILGPGFATEGDVAISNGRLRLGWDARLYVGPPGLPPQASSLAFTLVSGDAAASLALENGATLTIDSDGRISIDAEDSGLRIDARHGSRVAFALEPAGNGLRIYGQDGAWVPIPSRPAPEARWTLGATATGPATVTEVSARAFDASSAILGG